MVSYSPATEISPELFQSYDTKEGGALETDGDLQTQITIDFESKDAMGGVFKQVKGRAEIVWPATEHAFVLEGEVEIRYYDKNETIHYKPGDGWVINKGERVSWNVVTPTFRKSYFLLLNEQ